VLRLCAPSWVLSRSTSFSSHEEQEFKDIFMMLCPVWKSFYYQKNDLIKEMWYIKGGCLLEIDPLRALIIWTNHEQIVVHATEFCDCINYNSN
jgi:hypothetical protein